MTRVCNILRERRADISEPFFYDFARTCRKRGIGLVVASQTPGLLPVPVLANLSTWYAFKPVDAASVRVLSNSLGLRQEQLDYFLTLAEEKGRVVVVRHPVHHLPFLLQVSEVEMAPSPPQVVREAVERTKRWLGPVPAGRPPDEREREKEREKRPEAAAGETDQRETPTHPYELPKRCLDYLQAIAETPFLPVTERDKRLGLSSWKGNRIRQELKDTDMLRFHEVNMGLRGKQITLTEPTDKAYHLLDALQVKVERPSGNGGFAHRFWQDTIYRWAVNQGYPARIEQALDKKRVDIGVQWVEKRCAVEVVMEGLEKELSNLKKDLEEGWDMVVFCAEDQETLDQLERMVEAEFGEAMKKEGKVRFRRFREFIVKKTQAS